MVFGTDMVTKEGEKMMYLLSIGVKEDCEDYDAIWTELERRMNAVSIPIVRVDWPLYDDNGEAHDYSECLFYAQSFEIGMGFIMGIMEVHEIRSNLEYCNFYNGDAYENDTKKYDAENTLDAAKECLAEFNPDEEW